MKKAKTNFETQFLAVPKMQSGVQLMENFFKFNELAASKEKLSNIINYAIKGNTWLKGDPSAIFHFRQSMQSFIRAGYLMTLKKKKRYTTTPLENVSPWLPGLLSEKEYQNPMLVFKKAFEEYSIKEFDYFISGIVYFSLGAYGSIPESNIVSPYIHLTKMLDAAHLILERRAKG